MISTFSKGGEKGKKEGRKGKIFETGGDLDWKYYTTNESHACMSTGGSCYWPRGKNLGGTTVHHGMAYHRGHPKDYEKWVEQGAFGWSWDEVNA